ncbi:MspA protein [Nocardia tenerifensis]|uniref:MspA protein n=1 Tax=Nocardia tenerifensis TaxID=228006 RepID=A0A318KBB4_9NOCA|nr:MspA family porin [Nocardia tenerifensis]PXX68510.1 MspA protein [Nocardia tenerifensis]
MLNRKKLTRPAGLGAAVAVTMGLFSTGVADADIVIPLPGGETAKTLADGTVVTVQLVDESAEIGPTLDAPPHHRSARVSGRAQVEMAGSQGGQRGSIFPGYAVGCAVDIAQAVTGDLTLAGDANDGVATGRDLTLAPGQAKSFYVLDLEQDDYFGSAEYKTRNQFEGSSGSVSWTGESIDLSGCDGYAQARAFVSVSVETDSIVTWMTLWGKPFIIG